MTSQIRPRIEYLLPTDNILVLLSHTDFILKSSFIDGFQYDLMTIQKWLTFYWATLYMQRHFIIIVKMLLHQAFLAFSLLKNLVLQCL